MRISDWSSDVCSSDLPVPLEQLESARQALRAAQFRMLQRAAEVEIVGGAIGDRDANARPVDVFDGLQGRARRHQVGRLDRYIGVAERDGLDRKSTRLNSSH